MAGNNRSDRLVKAAVAVGLAVAGVLLVPAALDWHRARLISDMGRRLPDMPPGEVRRVVDELVELDAAAVPVLVEASASPRAVVASKARDALATKLDCWRTELDGGDSPAVEGVTVLAVELKKHAGGFSPGGKLWAERLAVELIELASELPPRESARVLSAADGVLASVPPRGPRLRNLSALRPGAVEEEQEAGVPRLEDFTADLIPPVTPSIPGAGVGGETEVSSTPQGDAGDASTVERPPLEWRKQEVDHDASPRVLGNARAMPGDGGSRSVGPVARLPRSGQMRGTVVDVPPPSKMLLERSRLRRMPTPELMERLQRANEVEQVQLRGVLRERGLGDRELRGTDDLFSSDEKTRAGAVECLSVWPPSEARTWLRVLVEDSSPEVRLRALTQLAVSGDPRVVQLARRISQEDPDRRVADTASRILDSATR